MRNFEAEITDKKDHWIEVTAGPYRFYFVDDGKLDIAFSVDVEDDNAALEILKQDGFAIDEETSSETGEMFVRSPEGVLINLYPPQNTS